MCAASFQSQNHTAVNLNAAVPCSATSMQVTNTPVLVHDKGSARGLGSERAGLALPGTNTQARTDIPAEPHTGTLQGACGSADTQCSTMPCDT